MFDFSIALYKTWKDQNRPEYPRNQPGTNQKPPETNQNLSETHSHGTVKVDSWWVFGGFLFSFSSGRFWFLHVLSVTGDLNIYQNWATKVIRLSFNRTNEAFSSYYQLIL